METTRGTHSSRAVVTTLLVMATLALGARARSADVELDVHPLFSDHMVLQRGKPVPVWGHAPDGAEVVVAVAGREARTVARDGAWRVELDPLEAGGPHELVVRSSARAEPITFGDVLIGEVWLCSGQSNMQWAMRQSYGGKEEADGSRLGGLRLLTVPRRTSTRLEERADVSWVECSPETVIGFSAVGYWFGKTLHEARGVPVGLIHTSWGGTPSEAWTRREALLAHEPLRRHVEAFESGIEAWETSVEEAKAAGTKPPGRPGSIRANHQPGALYNAMIHPLIPYAVAGAIWYQGESNRGRYRDYDLAMRTLIGSWRRDWGDDFPFLFTQLAPWEPGGYEWPGLWEQQTRTLGLAKTGMAIILDGRPPEGERRDIHPKNKRLVGERLALLARSIAYGEGVVASGPLFTNMTTRPGAAVVWFDHVGSGLASDGDRLEGFEVAGDDGVFHAAEARIEGPSVVVTSPAVAEPAAVRYAWSSWPKAGLRNREGLPASPFRTDTLPIATVRAD